LLIPSYSFCLLFVTHLSSISLFPYTTLFRSLERHLPLPQCARPLRLEPRLRPRRGQPDVLSLLPRPEALRPGLGLGFGPTPELQAQRTVFGVPGEAPGSACSPNASGSSSRASEARRATLTPARRLGMLGKAE